MARRYVLWFFMRTGKRGGYWAWLSLSAFDRRSASSHFAVHAWYSRPRVVHSMSTEATALIGVCLGWGGAMYEYDLFVSYRREPGDDQLVTPWLREVLRRVMYWVGQDMGGKRPKVFFDEQSIEVGDDWPDKIKTALLSAKCLLPVWSPEYFQSAWCLAEWRSFLDREKLFADRGQAAYRLIIPIKFHDGKWFPPEARQLTPLDLSEYAATTEAFWKTVRADELDRILMVFARKVADFVHDAPPYEDGWPVSLPTPEGPPEDVAMVRL